MNIAGPLLGILCCYLLNEIYDISPWFGRVLARWAAHLRYADPLRAHVRAEELAAHIDARPGKLLKLCTAAGLFVSAVGAALGRRLGRPDRLAARSAATTWRLSAIESLSRAIYAFGDIRGLPRASRRRFISLTRLLLQLLGSPAGTFDRRSRDALLALVAHTGAVLVENRDDRAGAALIAAARPHVILLDADRPAALSCRFTGAMAALRIGDRDWAESELRDVHTRQTRVLGPGHPETVESCRYLAWALVQQGRPDEAEVVFAELGAMIEQAVDTTATQRLHFDCMYAWLLGRQRRWADAEAAYRAVIESRAALLGPLHADTLDAEHSLAQVLLAMGDTPGARDLCARVLVARRRIFGARHPDTLETRKYHALATARIDRRRVPAARRELRRILRTQTSRLGADHPSTADTRACLLELVGSPGA
ncbi:tetratricopeptide repeat protein [Parafrankia sp. EUN1f]|uniref:tetratricopeptide repeat protein n=1 Tax=Parafrankia sp. EUN1f TaxID=102897 RepID=UPI0001C44A0F|nr:tetratricopeptide repeat protein [Parafrankia sp. EUN1f]EFC85278.1 Tetratricopeptide TPR_4 protein [Parafrankia sp. EUN1f]